MSLTKTKGASSGTWSHQATLPRLPVPDFHESCSKMLHSLELFSESPQELEEFKKDLEQFIQSEGSFLHSKLLEHDQSLAQKTPRESWIDKWWLNYAYLSYREPLPINSNVHLMILPEYPVSREARAAFLMTTVLKFKEQLDTGSYRPQTVPRLGNIPLCMEQFRRFFGVDRIPGEFMDELSVIPTSKHFAVICKDHFFKINAYPNGNHVTEQSLKSQFESIIAQTSNIEPGIPVGVLTAQNRDHWARIRQKMVELSETNRETLEAIETAILVISFTDDYPTDITEQGQITMHGRDGRNRWFDKSIDFCFFRNGKVGLVGEHTPFEATQPMQLFDWILKREAQHSYRNTRQLTSDPSVEEPQKLNWVLPEEIKSSIEQGSKDFKKLIEKVDLRVFKFDDFGNQWIKKFCKVSPDSFIQMALQITYFRLHKRVVPTYETASTRQFLNGRTETGRPASPTSVELCKLFDSKDSSAKKIELFKEASSHHVNYMMDCFNGKGWDRHMFGLRILAAQEQSETFKPPKLFSNPLFKRGNRFLLSTSNISPGSMYCGGFGIIDPEGYGVCYLLESDHVWFNISSSFECPQTSSTEFEITLIRTLLDLRSLFQTTNKM